MTFWEIFLSCFFSYFKSLPFVIWYLSLANQHALYFSFKYYCRAYLPEVYNSRICTLTHHCYFNCHCREDFIQSVRSCHYSFLTPIFVREKTQYPSFYYDQIDSQEFFCFLLYLWCFSSYPPIWRVCDWTLQAMTSKTKKNLFSPW